MKKLNIQPEMRSSYIGIGVLSLVVLFVVCINLVGNLSIKSDSKLEQEVQSQHQKIETYARRNKKLPDTVFDAGIDETEGVEYKKVSNSKYMLCAEFKTKSDGYSEKYDYSEGGRGLLDGASVDTGSKNTKYQDGSYTKHDEGYNCIVYTSYTLSNPYISGYKACGDETYKYRTRKYIKSIDSSSKTIVASSTKTSLPSSNTSSKSIMEITFDLTSSKVNDYNCNNIEISSLTVGDAIYLYTNESVRNSPYTDTTPDVVKLVK